MKLFVFLRRFYNSDNLKRKVGGGAVLTKCYHLNIGIKRQIRKALVQIFCKIFEVQGIKRSGISLIIWNDNFVEAPY